MNLRIATALALAAFALGAPAATAMEPVDISIPDPAGATDPATDLQNAVTPDVPPETGCDQPDPPAVPPTVVSVPFDFAECVVAFAGSTARDAIGAVGDFGSAEIAFASGEAGAKIDEAGDAGVHAFTTAGEAAGEGIQTAQDGKTTATQLRNEAVAEGVLNANAGSATGCGVADTGYDTAATIGGNAYGAFVPSEVPLPAPETPLSPFEPCPVPPVVAPPLPN